MPLYCHDGERGECPRQPSPMPRLGVILPPESPELDRCSRPGCRLLAWQHWTVQR